MFNDQLAEFGILPSIQLVLDKRIMAGIIHKANQALNFILPAFIAAHLVHHTGQHCLKYCSAFLCPDELAIIHNGMGPVIGVSDGCRIPFMSNYKPLS